MLKPNNHLEHQIGLWIEENGSAFVKNLNRLVAIPGVSVAGNNAYPFGRHCADVLDEMSALAVGYGFRVANHDYYCGNLLVKGRSPQAKRIGLYSHLDVVSPGDGWYYPPFSCTEKGGFLIGRGGWDNKGPALCSLYALHFFKSIISAFSTMCWCTLDCPKRRGWQILNFFVAPAGTGFQPSHGYRLSRRLREKRPHTS